jgi:hypothetical protein
MPHQPIAVKQQARGCQRRDQQIVPTPESAAPHIIHTETDLSSPEAIPISTYGVILSQDRCCFVHQRQVLRSLSNPVNDFREHAARMGNEVLITDNHSLSRARSLRQQYSFDIIPHPPKGIRGRRDRTKQKLPVLPLGMSTLTR